MLPESMLREYNTLFCVIKALVEIFTHILTVNCCYHSFSHFLSLVGMKGYLCVTFISLILVEYYLRILFHFVSYFGYILY